MESPNGKSDGKGGALGPTGPGALAAVLAGANGLPAGFKPYAREIFLIGAHVAGTTHVEDIETIAAGIEAGTRLYFYREPGNPHDANAILIEDDRGRKTGYVPRDRNEILARLMDAGKRIYAVAAGKATMPGGWLRIEIEIYLED